MPGGEQEPRCRRARSGLGVAGHDDDGSGQLIHGRPVTARSGSGRPGADDIAHADRALGQDFALSGPPMNEPGQDSFLSEVLQVPARLAEPRALREDFAHPEFLVHQVVSATCTTV